MPLGNGYLLTRTEFWITEAIGLAFLAPGVVLSVLAKMKMVTAAWGIGGFVAALVLAFAAVKVYVAAAKIPIVKRTEADDE